MKIDNIKLYKLKSLVLIAVFVCFFSCKDFLEIDPPVTEVTEELVFDDDNSAESTIRGLYARFINSHSLATGREGSVTYLLALSGDNLNYLGIDDELEGVFNADILSDSRRIETIWTNAFETIFYANSILDGLQDAPNVSDGVKGQLQGEALFMRAFCNFYMVNLFGPIPLVQTVNVETNRNISRSEPSLIYESIISDLLQSEELLADDFSFGAGERLRPNKAAPQSLLARAYLYTEEWSSAIEKASLVIDHPDFQLEADPTSVFLANSSESIFQMIDFRGTVGEALTFPVTSASNLNHELRPDLLNLFEPEDLRLQWVDTIDISGTDYIFPFKYRNADSGMPGVEYSTLLRLAEVYLIRAEAYARSNNVANAISDLNVIRNRAGLPNSSSSNQSEVIDEIEVQRRLELFAEWGHRWLDLKRTNRLSVVVGPIKADWTSEDALYPVPLDELELNQNLGSQNPGY